MKNNSPSEVFAVNLAALAREISMDIFPLPQILELHNLSDDQWIEIQRNPRFQSMLEDMVRSWNSAANTKERVKVKSQTGLESILEIYIRDIVDGGIPLAQRVEAGKFLAKLGEMDGSRIEGSGGGGFSITLNIGDVHRKVEIPTVVGKVIEHEGVD